MKKDQGLLRRLWSIRQLYLMFLPAMAYFIIFKYIPMGGIIIAFQEFSPFKGIRASDWVGLENFRQLFQDPYFYKLIKNTMILAFYSLLFGFPIPIAFAILLNEVKFNFLKKIVQTVSFFPYFISSAVAVGLLYTFLSPQGGLVNEIRYYLFGYDPIFYMSEPGYFRGLFVGLGVWKEFGYGAIIYLAAIAGIDQSQYEAAEVDGANRWHKIWHVTIPSIRNTIIILLIISVGNILSVNLDMILLMYNPNVYETSDVIQSYVYRRGFGVDGFPDYSFASAVGLFQSIVAFILILTANQVAKRYSETRFF